MNEFNIEINVNLRVNDEFLEVWDKQQNGIGETLTDGEGQTFEDAMAGELCCFLEEVLQSNGDDKFDYNVEYKIT